MIKFIQQECDRVFDPDAVCIMAAAFDEAWQSLQTNTPGVILRARTEAIREVLAKDIIEMASHGERDQRRLRASALHHLAQTTFRSAPRATIGDISD